jgi:hypothetical protein
MGFLLLLFWGFLAGLGFEFRASCLLGRRCTSWTTLPALFCVGYFQDRVSWNACPSWPWTIVLLISASQVAGIIDMSHWHLAMLMFCNLYTLEGFMPFRYILCRKIVQIIQYRLANYLGQLWENTFGSSYVKTNAGRLRSYMREVLTQIPTNSGKYVYTCGLSFPLSSE